ncbi:MAG TPA: hypothetical protein VLX92_16060, partial [Kofleriaceae bacterium]|nr:hypothetical protein [Kofleriaceae bacterium]
MKWLRRIVLGLLAVIALAVIAVIVIVHTAFGREQMRERVEAALAQTFTGGATVRRLDGSPFGEIVLHDLVIDGPDHRPAIAIGALHVKLHLLDLLAHRAHVAELVADDVDVAIRRDRDGKLELARLLADRGPRSAWDVELDRVAVRRGHVAIDSGAAQLQTIDLDDLAIDGRATLRADGRTDARVALHATWRERAVPIALAASLHGDGERTALPALDVRVGGVTLVGRDLALARPAAALRASGTLAIAAPRAELARLVPAIDLPGDLALAIRARPAAQRETLAIGGAIGPAFVSAQVALDPVARRAVGRIATGELDLARLSRGRLAATAGGTIDFDVTPGPTGALPYAHATIRGHGALAHTPRSDFTIALDSGGQRVATAIDATGTFRATITASVARVRGALRLDQARVVASTPELGRVTDGASPVHGALALDFTAHGPLWPEPALAIAGTLRGDRLVGGGASIRSLQLALDATGVPRAPRGTARLRGTELARGAIRIAALALDAHDRGDGTIAVSLATPAVTGAPIGATSLALEAIVTPPGRGRALAIDVAHATVTPGGHPRWAGSGRLTIAPDRIAIARLRGASRDGSFAIEASYSRGARGARLAGTADVEAATAGGAKLAFDLDAPAALGDVAAWRARRRDQVRRLSLALHGVALDRVAALVGMPPGVAGRIDGELAITPTAA